MVFIVNFLKHTIYEASRDIKTIYVFSALLNRILKKLSRFKYSTTYIHKYGIISNRIRVKFSATKKRITRWQKAFTTTWRYIYPSNFSDANRAKSHCQIIRCTSCGYILYLYLCAYILTVVKRCINPVYRSSSMIVRLYATFKLILEELF